MEVQEGDGVTAGEKEKGTPSRVFSPLGIELTGLKGCWNVLHRGRNGFRRMGIKILDLSLSCPSPSKGRCQVACWKVHR